ncbi:uncharacterized protein LOC130053962 [Ostrea edulis]|nr:uncharacterized protein LOC130053962 [Ostrea edulis]
METNGSNGFPLIGQFESDEDPELSTPTSLQALPITTTMPPTAHSLAATQNPQTTATCQGPPPTTTDKTYMQPPSCCTNMSAEEEINYTMTETWGMCSSAMDAINQSNPGTPPPLIQHSSPKSAVELPVPSTQVMAILEGLLRPDVQNYIREVINHTQQMCNSQSFTEIGKTNSSTRQTRHDFLSEYRQHNMNIQPLTALPTNTDEQTADFNDSIDTGNFLHFRHSQTRATMNEMPQNNIPAASFLEESSTSPIPPSEPFLNSQTPLPQLRRSPRKHNNKTNMQKTKLIEGQAVEVDPNGLRKATSAARKSQKPGYTLCYKLLAEVFSLQTLASSRGQGIGKVKEGDIRPTLDKEKISTIKNYVTVWCRKNECVIPTETVLNDAITERISYARKQLRPKKTTDKTDKCS